MAEKKGKFQTFSENMKKLRRISIPDHLKKKINDMTEKDIDLEKAPDKKRKIARSRKHEAEI